MIYKRLPNYLTIARILIIPVIMLTFYFEHSKLSHQIGAGLFVVASITDFLDGFLARRYNGISSFGKILDPIADKLLIAIVLIMLIKYNKINEIPCILILSREFLVTGFREFFAQVKVNRIPVSNFGKIKTALQMVALTTLILGTIGSGISCVDFIGQLLLWAAAILTVFTGFSYLYVSLKNLPRFRP